jgi:hypothetical protein
MLEKLLNLRRAVRRYSKVNRIDTEKVQLEWFDSKKIKKILNLPRGAKVSLVVTCGIREENWIHGPRFRIPFQEQYKRI